MVVFCLTALDSFISLESNSLQPNVNSLAAETSRGNKFYDVNKAFPSVLSVLHTAFICFASSY